MVWSHFPARIGSTPGGKRMQDVLPAVCDCILTGLHRETDLRESRAMKPGFPTRVLVLSVLSFTLAAPSLWAPRRGGALAQDAARFQIPPGDEGLPGSGPIRRSD